MATPPDFKDRPPSSGRSWSALLNEARRATPPVIDVRSAVRRELSQPTRPVIASEPDWADEFIRLFCNRRSVACCAALVLIVALVGGWQIQTQLTRLDPLGGLQVFARVSLFSARGVLQ